MKVKYNNSDVFYNIDNFEYINFERVRLFGEEAKDNTSGFDVYNDEGNLVQSCQEHKVVYEVGDGFVEYTNDTYTYYVYHTYNDEGFITGILSSWQNPVDNGLLIKHGQGKEFAEPTTDMVFVDEDGLYNYKVKDGKVVKISAKEKAVMKNEKDTEEFSYALEIKLSDISAICSASIVKGVDYNGEHYSYEITDQNNIKSAINLAGSTGLDVPYHADNESCRLYSPDEIIAIYVTNETNLTHHTTYYNQLKLYTQTLTTKEEVDAVVYGQPLEGEYLETYVMIMAQAKKIIAAFLNVDEETVDGILGNSNSMAMMLE